VTIFLKLKISTRRFTLHAGKLGKLKFTFRQMQIIQLRGRENKLLMAEFQKAFQYTKGLIGKDMASIILYIAALIPFVNFFVLARYVDKIVSEPSNSIKPPRLVNPKWMELIMSLLKIIVVALVWGLIAVVLIVPVGLIFGAGLLGGVASMMTLVEKFTARSFGAGIVGFIILVVISLFAIISEVNMLKKGKNLTAAFSFKDLLDKILKIGWLRYLLYTVSLLVAWAIAIFFTSVAGDYLGIFAISVLGIITLFIGTFFAKTISVLYDQNSVVNPT
jgi:hypothetical protein